MFYYNLYVMNKSREYIYLIKKAHFNVLKKIENKPHCVTFMDVFQTIFLSFIVIF